MFLFSAVVYQLHNRSTGDLLVWMRLHTIENLDNLINLAPDKVYWKSLESSIPSHLRDI